jgi:phage tail sheath protein FI
MGHGVEVSEVPTGVKPPVQISAGLPVYVGTAPVNAGDPTNVNKPNVFYTLAEFVTALGPVSSDFESWTLHEAAKAHFEVYSVAPIVCINVLDPTKAEHKAQATDESHQLVDGSVQLQVYGGPDEPMIGVIASTVVVKKNGSVKTLGTDYELAFDEDGFLLVSTIAGGTVGANDVITASFSYLDPSGVTAADVIGGYSGGVYKGLEVIDQVYPALRLVPGFLLAPKWSQEPTVAARLAAKAPLISGAFKTMALTDLSTDRADIASAEAAPAWKTDNGFGSAQQLACWPKSKNGDDVFHVSTVAACVANLTDADNDNLPFASPSNKTVIGTSAVLDDDTEVLLTRDQANALNAQGIVTLLNGFNGWRLWGNRTAGYPATTDVKDAFIPIRRMFNWIANTIILTTDANIDAPISRRMVDLIVGTITSWLNGLVAAGALVDGKIEFRSNENPTESLSDGKIAWHVTLTPPSPAEEQEYILEYDPTALSELFSS